MIAFVSCGPVPLLESPKASTHDIAGMRQECLKYMTLLETTFPVERPMYFVVYWSSRDRGFLAEVRLVYDDADDIQTTWAAFIERNLPKCWA